MIYPINHFGEMGDKWITASEAARILRVSRQRVFQMIRGDILNAARFSGRNWLLRDEVEDLIRRPVGRPRKDA